MFNFSGNLPLTLYVHIPWCKQKCPYCDFNSHAVDSNIQEREYVDALIADLDQDLPLIWGRRVKAIFIGGGTPSLFSPESIDRLLSELRSRLNFVPHLEVTMEANPGTVEADKFSEFHAIGINRLSIGVQSFHDAYLRELGRIHNGKEAIIAAELAVKSGFDNFNLDLMFGLPGQSGSQVLKDINTAISLQPSHISFYQLTIEPNTLFSAHPPASLPDENSLWTMQKQGSALLNQQGYMQYEVSAYSQAGKQCAHNLNYWQFGDYLGIGAGAHAKITSVENRVIRRLAKTKLPKRYMATAGTIKAITSDRILTEEDACFEFMMNVLRLTQGFPIDTFLHNTGLVKDQLQNALETAQTRGLLKINDNILKPTELGRRFLNDLVSIFLPN